VAEQCKQRAQRFNFEADGVSAAARITTPLWQQIWASAEAGHVHSAAWTGLGARRDVGALLLQPIQYIGVIIGIGPRLLDGALEVPHQIATQELQFLRIVEIQRIGEPQRERTPR
jgi:hypothetical protein